MNQKICIGQTIYHPTGRAKEYSLLACNFYNGCSARCAYCFHRNGDYSEIVGGDIPTLKRGLCDDETALRKFRIALKDNLAELQEHGLLLNFVSDPFLPETTWLNQQAIYICHQNNVPVKVLTKQTKWVNNFIWDHKVKNKLIACGFTLTGHDELEPGAASNQMRIEAMKRLNDYGYKTFASIEPIIDFNSSFQMIEQTLGFCDVYMIGLERDKAYNRAEVKAFVLKVMEKVREFPDVKIYWKNSMKGYFPEIRTTNNTQIIRNVSGFDIFRKE